MKRGISILLFLLFTGTSVKLAAQSGDWREWVEQLAEEGIDNSTIEKMYDELLQWENDPMDLNKVTLKQLENFPLLSSNETSAIYQFLEKNRPVYSVYELWNVPSLEFNTVARILPFFYVGENKIKNTPPTPAKIIKSSRHEIQFRFDKTLSNRSGYQNYPDSILARYPNRRYNGEDFYSSLRYSLQYNDRLQLGFIAEKDAGEPFFKKNYPKGFDHYGAYLLLKQIGIIKTFILGDYRLSLGQGLILNNDFLTGKTWGNDNIARRTLEPKRHFSTAENGFFRGMATTIGFGKLSITGFLSNRHFDGNLSDNGEITSFKTDGLHRTLLEISKKNNSKELVTGGNLNFRNNRLQMGISALYYHFNRIFNPVLKTYNQYMSRGSSGWNASIDYSWQLPGMIFAGETALAENGAVATLNTLQYRFSDLLSMSLLYRHYPISYNALYGQAFSENSKVQNERGLYLGTGWNPFSHCNISAFIDLVRFPWPKYGTDAPSEATDIYLLGTYNFSESSTVEIRYKYKQKEKNAPYPDEKNKSVLPYSTHKLRFRFLSTFLDYWNYRLSIDGVKYQQKHFPSENGYLISQNLSFRKNNPVNADAFISWFNADTYNARVYSYERNIMNTYYMPSFYGKGYRAALSVKYSFSNNFSLSIKWGYTHYLNKDSIGSGTEKINGDSRTDLFTYLKWRF